MSAAGLDPNYWVNVRNPRVNKTLSPLDVHQADRQPARKSPDGTFRREYRSAAARARRAARKAHKRANSGRSFREAMRANQSTVTP